MKLGSHKTGICKTSRFKEFEGLLRTQGRSAKRRPQGGHRKSLPSEFIDLEVQEMLESKSQLHLDV